MKKLLLILFMFLFVTNVKALSFDVNLTNIEYKGNNNTTGSISNIDLNNKEVNILFQNPQDEVNFEITIMNTGEKAGVLKSITPTVENDKIEYTTNLSENGLSINANTTNKVLITAKLKDGAVNRTSTSILKITYSYDVGSCPDEEILSRDESECLCPDGFERNTSGVCEEIVPKPTCNDGEIYDDILKKCVIKTEDITEEPINNTIVSNIEVVENPKTLDNIILITLLFIVSGLGIYAAIFKRLGTSKKKTLVGLIVGIITLGTTFTVLVGVFGFDNLVATIINPITKTKDINITINETISLQEEECTLDNGLCPKYLLSTDYDDFSGYSHTWTINKDDLAKLTPNKSAVTTYIKQENGVDNLCVVLNETEYCYNMVDNLRQTDTKIREMCNAVGGTIVENTLGIFGGSEYAGIACTNDADDFYGETEDYYGIEIMYDFEGDEFNIDNSTIWTISSRTNFGPSDIVIPDYDGCYPNMNHCYLSSGPDLVGECRYSF